MFKVLLDDHCFESDEAAYRMLKRMLSRFRNRLRYTDLTHQDLEKQFAEFLLKLKGDDKNYVISTEDVINAGEYLDSKLNAHYTGKKNFKNPKTPMYKKLYRDSEDRVIGGVIAGLGHYLSLDVVWLRIIAIVLAWVSLGTAVLCYLVLWIIIPKANTEYRRARMHGIFSDFEDLKSKAKKEFDAAKNNVNSFNLKDFFQSISHAIADFFRRFQSPRSTSRL
ncbi:MAG: PspC domain-containing protein [Flavobacteriaceae bacterium]|nr:PspC domain-containing protein [Flavobacteriaceae bacterium]MCY4268364.1 PspC domain-containing protein [Flavobacteriaceae bacterium]